MGVNEAQIVVTLEKILSVLEMQLRAQQTTSEFMRLTLARLDAIEKELANNPPEVRLGHGE